MKKLTLYFLAILLITCGCGVNNTLQKTSTVESNYSEETLSQENNQQITNQEASLNEELSQEKIKEEDLEENLHPIDKAERDCIAKQDATQAMNVCTYKARDAWYKEIDKYMNLLKTITSEDEYNNILEAQIQWKKYQEAEFKAVSILINKQGTMYQNITAGIKTEIVKQRANNLKSFYDYLIEE